MNYETVIGLEVHAQLLTNSKMFCSCNAVYQDAPPNTVVCEVCMGMPGALPVINRRAVELVIKTGLALDCTISELTKFDRKNYPYPDLMKGYQISQYDRPIALDGELAMTPAGTRSWRASPESTWRRTRPGCCTVSSWTAPGIACWTSTAPGCH